MYGDGDDDDGGRYLQGPAADSYVWLFSRLEDEHESKTAEMEATLANATQKLAAVEAREKVYTDSIEAQQKEMVTLSTSKMQARLVALALALALALVARRCSSSSACRRRRLYVVARRLCASSCHRLRVVARRRCASSCRRLSRRPLQW